MPAPDVQTVVKDPEFQALPWGERHKVMAQIDPDYAALPRGEQAKALDGLKKMPFWKPSTPKVPDTVSFKPLRAQSGSTRDVMGIATPKQKTSVANLRMPSVNEAARVGMQGIGATAGGILGAASPVPGGAAMGGALGYAISNKVADMTLRDRPANQNALVKALGVQNPVAQQLTQSAGDIGVGAGYELMGVGMGAAGRGIGNTVDLGKRISDKGIKSVMSGAMENAAMKQAGKKIIAARTTTPAAAKQIEKNTAENQKVEEAIKGLQLNLGQKGGDPNLLSMSRQVGQTPGAGTALQNESVMSQNKALGDYVQKNIVGKGEAGNWLGSLRSEQQRLAQQTAKVSGAVELEASKLAGAAEDTTGRQLRQSAVARRTASSAAANKLYSAVPETLQIDSKPLWDKVKSVMGDFDYATQRLSATPTSAANRVESAMKPQPSVLLDASGKPMKLPELPEKLTLKQFKDFRSQVASDQREAYAKGDYDLGRKLGQLKSGVSESLAQAAENGQGEGIDALRKASQYWRSEHVPTYRQGVTADVLETDRTGAYNVLDSSVGGHYFKAGKGAIEAAKDFQRTFKGDGEAKAAIKDYASQSLLKSARDPYTGELVPKKVANWVAQHRTALEVHGLSSEFNNIQKSLKLGEAAKQTEKAFNKSSLATALDVDPDRAIETALFTGAGRKQSITRLQELVRLARKDASGSAIQGLRSAIGEYFQRKTQTTARDIAGGRLESYAAVDKFVREFLPAMEQSKLYTSAQINAFKNVHKALGAIAQQQRPHPGFNNSATYELFTRMAGKSVDSAFGHIGIYGAAKGVYSLLQRPIKESIDNAVARAVFDPRYAEVLTQLATNVKRMPLDKAERQFANRMQVLGGLFTIPNISSQEPLDEPETGDQAQ